MKINLLLAVNVAQGRYGMNPGIHSFRNNVWNKLTIIQVRP